MTINSFAFLDLPPEIREKIYILICAHPDNQPISLDLTTNHISYPHNLLLTNTQIYHEIRPMYFIHNSFAIIIRRHNGLLSHFLSPSFQDNRRQISSLSITIQRWGTKDFFVTVLIPLLEDCILNGKLKRLEVAVNEDFLRRMGRLRGGNEEEYVNWKVLKRVLMDPYLVTGVLRVINEGEGEVERDMEREKKLLKDVGFDGGIARGRLDAGWLSLLDTQGETIRSC